MAKVDVYLKGGAVMALDLEDLTVTTSGGTVTKIAWVNGKHKPLYISPSEVAAVIER